MYPYDWNRERNLKNYEFNDRSFAKLTGDEFAENPLYEHFNLKYSDPGKLLWLVSTLYDGFILSLEIKINEYLQNVTNSPLGFIIHKIHSGTEMVICVLGLVDLAPDFSVSETDFWERIKRANCPVLIGNIDYFPEKLKVEIENYVKNFHSQEFQNAVIFPIRVTSTEHEFYYCLVNCGETTNISQNYGLINECFRFCGVLVVTTFAYNEEICHVKACKAVVDTCIATLPYIDSLKSFWESLKTEISESLKTEDTMVYFCKHIDDNHTTIFDFETDPEEPEHDVDDIFPYQFGLEGKMLKQCRFLNTSNPKKHIYLGQYLKKETKSELRNTITFPLVYKNISNAIIEAFNKGTDELKFNKFDEDYAKCIGSICGIFLHQAFKFLISKEKQERYTYVNCQNLRRIQGDPTFDVDDILNCKDPHEYEGMLEFSFLPSEIPSDHTICFLVSIYRELGIIKSFEINESNLIIFLETIRSGYTSLPFHNWEHALCTTHFLFVLIKNFSLMKNGYVDSMEVLAFLTAAISHDIDFRGPTTPFQLSTGSTLGSLYGTPGKIKQHHSISLTLQILCRPKCNLAQNMSSEQFKVFVYLLEEYVLALDMTTFVRKLDDLNNVIEFEMFDKRNPEHKKSLNTLIMTTAHLSEYVKGKEYVDAFTKRQVEEFFRPEKSGLQKGVYDMSDLSQSPVKMVSLQVQFMNTIVVPAFTLLHTLFPTTYYCLEQIKRCCDSWITESERHMKAGSRMSQAESVISSLSEDESVDQMFLK